ncbi:MAG: DNA replication/repair protein RecF [Ilumatobacteraceae bacterium]
MIVSSLELVDFRNYVAASFEFDAGITAVVGLNGQGKTNLAEALAYLASLESFRGAPTDALIRVGADSAIVRSTVTQDDGREVLVELELNRNGRNRTQVNRQRLSRSRELLGVMRVTVFSPEDLSMIKGGPQERRTFLDTTLTALAVKYDALRLELERIIRQRNVLLKQVGGRLDGDAALTLDVWDAKLTDVGERFGHARAVLVQRLTPLVGEAYEQLADRPTPVGLRYEPDWRRTGLAVALVNARTDDVRRGASTVGPQRDDVELSIGQLPARTHASQGEQRTLALALRLGAHRLVAERAGSVPLLILDDVLSELDPHRATKLLQHLPTGQVILTTAGVLPDAAHPDVIVRIEAGAVLAS